MSTPTAADQPARLSDDTLLTERLEFLLQGAIRRQFWMLFLDGDDLEKGPLMPCDDLPFDPLGENDTEDLGTCTCAQLLAARVGMVMREFDLAQAVFVWERRGGPRIGDDERTWARELGAACAAGGVRVRGQFLLHDRGVRVLAPDDYL